MEIWVVDRPGTETANRHYVANRVPLAPRPLIPLRAESIEPRGWLRVQLRLMLDGLVGGLPQISPYLSPARNAWLDPQGRGQHGWEEVPYWLRGYSLLSYVLRDEMAITRCESWFRGILGSQRENGYFGPAANLARIESETGLQPDLWPNMVAVHALRQFYDHTNDPSVLEFLSNYFRWQLGQADERFLLPFWQQQRGGDNLYSVYWLYNRTGERWLLGLAEKVHRNTARWDKGIANWHGVNIAQCYREPAIYYQQSLNPFDLDTAERNYRAVMDVYGRVPGGMFAADENCRRGHTGARQAAEACTMVEFLHSHALMLAISGDARWADRCEEIAFNSLPAAVTADYRALRYLTAPNQVRADAVSKAPGVDNDGPTFLFDPKRHRCCQHNYGFGWPSFAAHLWMATPDNGLAAVMYSPAAVEARVGEDGTLVRIEAETTYPFEEVVRWRLQMRRAAEFPLYLRIPSWASDPEITINDKTRVVEAPGGRYVVIRRTWSDGDRVTIQFGEPEVVVHAWPAQENSVSVRRGALWYSLQIQEAYKAVEEDTEIWAAYEVEPKSAWNYGLCLGDGKTSLDCEVKRNAWPADGQPFVGDEAPIELRARGKRISNWTVDERGLIGALQPSPVRSNEPKQAITLIPMGGARLRLTVFPVIGDGAGARVWQKRAEPEEETSAEASHCWVSDTLAALTDEMLPLASNDYTIPRFTWRDHTGTREWVQMNFDAAREVSRTSVYWFDDRGIDDARVPKYWRLYYLSDDRWEPVKEWGPYGVEVDAFNTVRFEPVTTTGLRIEAQLRLGQSGGILEWTIE